MHVRYYYVTRSRNHCCYGNAKIAPFFVVIGVHVRVSNTEVFGVVMEMQQKVLFALLSVYKIFRTAFDNNKYQI